jgi:hypothetical protein
MWLKILYRLTDQNLQYNASKCDGFETQNLLFLRYVSSAKTYGLIENNMIQKDLILSTEIFHIVRNKNIVYFIFMLLQSFLDSSCAKFPNT